MARHLYRKPAVEVILLVLLALPTTWAQKKPPKGPRATALAVMAPDGKTASRLIPVCIRDNGQFWDASIYQASPRPMALESGIVYEIERTGTPVGLFTISNPVQENGSWIALGSSQPPQAHLARIPANSDDDRPVLRRSPSASSDSGSSAGPRELPAPATVNSDPDRPILQRGKPAPAGGPPVTSAPADLPADAKAASPPKPPELLPAISDADGPEPRPFVMDANADQQAQLRKATSALVEAALLKQAGMSPSAAHLEYKESSFRFFDLDGNNTAELVLTARVLLQPQAPVDRARRRAAPARSSAPSVALREFYLTFIGREDLEGTLHTALIRITDARNLDLDGRLELIDAADVDGDDRGELLFRRLIGHDVTYVIYKIGLGQTTKLFDSAGE